MTYEALIVDIIPYDEEPERSEHRTLVLADSLEEAKKKADALARSWYEVAPCPGDLEKLAGYWFYFDSLYHDERFVYVAQVTPIPLGTWLQAHLQEALSEQTPPELEGLFTVVNTSKPMFPEWVSMDPQRYASWLPVMPVEEPHTYGTLSDAAEQVVSLMEEYGHTPDTAQIYLLVPIPPALRDAAIERVKEGA